MLIILIVRAVGVDDEMGEGYDIQSTILAGKWGKGDQDLIVSTAKFVLTHLEEEGPIEVSLALANDEVVQNLNRDFRGQDKPTNVLSFEGDDGFDLPGEPRILGDVVLALETCQREAHEQQKSFQDHLTHLVVHGVLHLLGYDHIDDEDAQEMETLETDILARLNIADPYAGGLDLG